MKKAEESTTRRQFLQNSAMIATGLTVGLSKLGSRSVLGANNRIRIGFIGIGNQGSNLLRNFMTHENVDIVALCDVYEPYLLRDRLKVDKRYIDELGGNCPKMDEKFTKKVARYKDFRKLLERKDIDAVVVATPDHWHAAMTIMACQAGKDVYVEKPLCPTVYEGRRMIEVAKKTNRIVQVGIAARGSAIYDEAAALVRDGKIGQVSIARTYRINNMYPNGIGNYKVEEPPKDFDWDMWLGPREYQPYQYNIAPYRFRWWRAYSSQNGNWGIYAFDAMRRLMGVEAPVAVTAHASKSILKDDRTIPDTSEIICDVASGAKMIFGMYEANSGPMIDGNGEIEVRGTKGNLIITGRGYKVIPSRPGQFQDRGSVEVAEAVEKTSQTERNISTGSPTEGTSRGGDIISDFLDCIQTRNKPKCDIETGHRTNVFTCLANISEVVNSRVEWDPVNESITNNVEANKMLRYEYRKPWTVD